MRYICKKCHDEGFEGTVCIGDPATKEINWGIPIAYLIANQICKHDTKSTLNTAEWKEIT